MSTIFSVSSGFIYKLKQIQIIIIIKVILIMFNLGVQQNTL